MHLSQEEIKKLILDSGIVDKEDYEKAEKEAKRFNLAIENVLIGNNLITEEYFTELLSEHLGVPIANLLGEEIKFSDVELISEAIAKKKQLIAFGREGEYLKVAMVDPLDLGAIEFVKAKTGMPVRVYLTGLSNLK